MSPEHREYAEVLLQKSRDELRAAQTLIATEDYAVHIVGFLLQQAVEKSLKSVLVAHEIEVPLTHNLKELLRTVEAASVRLPASLANSDWLTPWGVTFRYDDPGVDLDTDRGLEAATAAIGLAEAMLADEQRS